MKTIVLAVSACVVVAFGAMALASPAVGVTPTLLGRGTYRRLQAEDGAGGPRRRQARGKEPARRGCADARLRGRFVHGVAHASRPSADHGGSRRGDVLRVRRPDLQRTVVTAGHGYVDTGHGHIGRNETGQPAKDVTVFFAPVGAGFRSELAAPGPHCVF